MQSPDSCLPASASPVLGENALPTPPDPAKEHTYGQILKSSVLIGGSTVIEITIGFVRTKANALLLGPSGFGLMGLYMSVLNLTQSITGMGVNSSGVRQIAAAAGSGDSRIVALTATVVRRVSIALGLLGALLLISFCGPISKLTFDSYEYGAPVALLSVAVLFRTVSDGQRALVQGLRRISDLATITVLGGVVGTVFSVALVYLFRERGLVPTLIAINAATLLFSWWFSRQVRLESPTLSVAQVSREARALLQLGVAFMASGMLTMGSAYAIRIMIMRQVGFEAAGLYQSAWTIGGLYVGFILQAMGADFYPRLTAAIRNRAACNRLVNEQAEVSLLLAGPGIIATLTFAPLVISLLYSSAFHEAVGILRWICLGATLQVITWPIGYIVVAEGRQGVFFLCEFAYTVVYVGIAWLFVSHVGLDGAGMAFFISYVFHGAMLYPVVRWLTGFRWSATNVRTGVLFLSVIGLVFASSYLLPFWLTTTLGVVALLLNTLYSARTLAQLVPAQRMPRPLQRLIVGLRLAGPGGH